MKSSRQTVEEAFNKLEDAGGDGGGESAPVVEASPEVEAAPAEAVSPSDDAGDGEVSGGAVESAPGRARGPDGKFVAKSAPAAPAAKASTVKPKADTKAPAQAAPTDAAVTPLAAVPPPPAQGSDAKYFVPTGKPPANLKKAIAEKWATIPKELQEEFERVNWEANKGMRTNAEAAKFRESFQAVAQQFPHILAGQDPVKGFGGYVQTIHNLRFGSAEQKAQLHEQIADAYGIPVDEAYLARQFHRRGLNIEKLAQAIDGMASGQPQQPQASAQQALDPEQIIAQAEARMMQRLQATHRQAQFSTFAQGHEFFEQLRPEIEDRLESARRRGVEMSLEQAYDAAVWADPELRAIVQQREAAKAANAKKASTLADVAAATPVKSRPAPQVNGTRPKTAQEAVAAAWEKLSAGR